MTSFTSTNALYKKLVEKRSKPRLSENINYQLLIRWCLSRHKIVFWILDNSSPELVSTAISVSLQESKVNFARELYIRYKPILTLDVFQVIVST